MKFLTTLIDTHKNLTYERLLKAWENSVVANTNSEYQIARLNPKHYPHCAHPKLSYQANSIKLNYWSNAIRYEDGNICLIDGDTVVLKDVEHVFEQDFDIAYTRRSIDRPPINGGVLFVKASEKVWDFFDKWVLTNNEMLTNPVLHRIWYRKYNGINQASFGYMLERYKSDLKIIEVPGVKYNACDKGDWIGINDQTHILHVKSDLRVACINGIVPKGYEKAIKIWKGYECK
jgi:alpha-N-acetylglucosamine transferase